MPMLEAFAYLGEEEAAAAAAEAAAAETAAGATAAEIGAAGLGAAELGTAGQGITQAGMATDVLAGGAGAGEAGINAAQVAAQQNAATAIPNSGIVSQTMTPAQQAYMNASTASAAPGITSGTVPLQAPAVSPYAGLQANTAMGQAGAAGVEPININAPGMGQAVPTTAVDGVVQPAAQSSPFMNGFKDAMEFAQKNPFPTAMLGMMGAKTLGLMDPASSGGVAPYTGSLLNYRMSPDFKASRANPQDYQYKPRYAEGGILNEFASGGIDVPRGETGIESDFAAGGIASYAKGGNLSSANERYLEMMDGKAMDHPAPARGPMAGGLGHDTGIYYDQDPDTRYQDALTAAQIRDAKVAKRANMQLPSAKRPTPMGQINLRPPGSKAEAGGSSLDPENAAHGGIMQVGGHLGGYAAGGNPRLLKGPGDGMSDDIPATIANKQPARLADGEFVVPADVVSHLGNGSTDAGAKKLHQMMTQVRKERTGNPKQGKQINPNKFMPK